MIIYFNYVYFLPKISVGKVTIIIFFTKIYLRFLSRAGSPETN